MRLRIFIVALVIAVQVIGAAPSSKASESGWAWRHKRWIPYEFTFHTPASLENPRVIVLRYQRQRERAVRRAVADWRTYEQKLKMLLRQAQAILALGQSVLFPATCVANAEEGGRNSTAGYFGTIYSPSSYGGVAAQLAKTYGESWLNWPWSAQLQVALDLFSRYGGSAWGASTRSKCGI